MSNRSWRAPVLVAMAMLGAFAASYASLVVVVTRSFQQCPGWYGSEGTIAAPKSLRGQLLCTADGDLGLLIFYWLPPLLLLATALVVWRRRRHVAWFAATLTLAASYPLIAGLAVAVTPADCTSGQLSRYGAEGCERDLELRHFGSE